MRGSDLLAFTGPLTARLTEAGAPAAAVAGLADAAGTLAALLDTDPATLTQSAWDSAVRTFEERRTALLGHLATATLGPLADLPVVRDALGEAQVLARTGLRLDVQLGPVAVAARSAVFYVAPPTLPGGVTLPAVPLGPFAVGSVSASVAAPGGGSAAPGGGSAGPGGGSLVRLTGPGGRDDGWGGTLSVPVPPVLVTATAVLSGHSGEPSFLALLGLQFVPPIQLSFGFSLDRVGGLVGVNRRLDTDALRAAVRTGAAGDALFSVRPPKDPAALAGTVDGLFPRSPGSHLVGPTLTLAFLSAGPAGSLVSLDLAVVVEVPAGRVAVLGVGRMELPSLPQLFSFRLDLLGLVDPVERLVSIDASLVDSHVLGIFQVYGDAALRLSWGSQPYAVLSVGGFFPGYDPRPARLPALRRVGMAMSAPGGVVFLRMEGYFALTSTSVHLGGRIEAGFDLVISAKGFIEVDALVQFRPFAFVARISAGFSVSVSGLSFASVCLTGQISGPGPVVIRGTLSISVFLFSISWDQTFTLGSGPADTLPAILPLLPALGAELRRAESLRAASDTDPEVRLRPRPAKAKHALVPPTGRLQLQQRLAPLDTWVERLHGIPLPSPDRVGLVGTGAVVLEPFASGLFFTLDDAAKLNRAPFEDLPAGQVLSPADPPLDVFPVEVEDREVEQVVIDTRVPSPPVTGAGLRLDLSAVAGLVQAAHAPPALSDAAPVIVAEREVWHCQGSSFTSSAQAHQQARFGGGAAMPATDLQAAVDLAGVV